MNGVIILGLMAVAARTATKLPLLQSNNLQQDMMLLQNVLAWLLTRKYAQHGTL